MIFFLGKFFTCCCCRCCNPYYFSVQVLHHGVASTSNMIKKINVYSFALKPEEHQPSGTCNFSRIDTARLETDSALTANDNMYAVNYTS